MLRHGLLYDPGNLEASITLGRSYEFCGSAGGAIETFTAAIKEHPHEARLYLCRGHVYKLRHDYKLATDDFTKAISIAPSFNAYLARGDTYLDRGRVTFSESDQKKALSDYDHLLTMPIDDRTRSLIYNQRAICFSSLGDYKQALRNSTSAIQFNRKNPRLFQNRAHVLSDLGSFEQALSDLKRAQRLDPQNFTVFINLAELYVTEGDFSRAKALLKLPVVTKHTSSNSYYLLGIACHGTGDYDGAVVNFSKAIALTPSQPIPYYRRALANLERKKTALAAADLDRAIMLDPDYAADFYLPAVDAQLDSERQSVRKKVSKLPKSPQVDQLIIEGLELEKRHQLAEAIARYSRAVELDPANAHVRSIRGHAFLTNKEPDRALSDLGIAADIRPSASTLTQRGQAFLQKREFAAAIWDYNRALAIDPRYAPALFLKAEAYEKQGRIAEAKRVYERFIDLARSSANRVPSEQLREAEIKLKTLKS